MCENFGVICIFEKCPGFPGHFSLFFPRLLHEFDRYLEKEDADTEPCRRFDIHCHRLASVFEKCLLEDGEHRGSKFVHGCDGCLMRNQVS